MNVTRESDSPTEVTLTISMDPSDEEPFLNRSYRRVVSRLQIPGFRPGKAPRSIVENHVGRAGLVQEALEFMIPESLDQVLREHDIKAFTEPDLEVLDLEPVSFKAVVPLEPEVDLGEISALSVKRPEIDVTDDDVNNVLEQLRYDAAPWEPADRPLAFGDLVTINTKGTIEGELAIDRDDHEYITQQDDQFPLPGFSIYLEGMRESQVKEFTLPVPEDYREPSYAGKECRFQVEVVSIKEKLLPEMDDEFAKGVREGYESLELLTADIRERLTESAELHAQRQLEQSSLEGLRDQATINASDLIYQRELDSMYNDRERSFRNQRLDMDTYLRLVGQTADELREELRPQAEQRLRTFLVVRKLADQESIEVDADEVDEEIDRIASMSDSDSEGPVRQALSADSAKDSIRSSLLQRKVLARLVEMIGDGAPEDAAEDTTEDAEAAATTGSLEVETLEVETPEVETPEVETLEVEISEVETPEVETSEIETPEIEAPEGDPIADTAAEGPGDNGGDEADPDTGQPAV